MNRLTAAAASLLLAAPAFAQTAEENPVAMEDVPQAAMDAALVEAEKYGITDASFDSVALDEGIYEFATTKDGMAFEVDVAEDGTVDEVEEEIAMDAVPAAVSDALSSELEGFEPTFIERSTRADGSIVFEFEGMSGGSEVDVEINEDGSNFTMNEDSAA